MPDDTGIVQLGRDLWRVRVNRVEERTGRVANRKQLVTGTKADARAVRDSMRQELASTVAAPLRLHLSAYAELWLQRRADNPATKPNTIRKYQYSLSHVLPVLGDIYLDCLVPSDIEGYIALRISQVGLVGGATVLNELRMLRTIARDSVADGYATRYWCDRVRPPPVRMYTRERPNLLTAPQVRLLLQHVPEQWMGLLLLLVTTGLRWGEASALCRDDVDLAAGEVVINWCNDRGRLITPKTKGSRRVVPLLQQVAEHFRDHPSGLLFPTAAGKLHRGTPLIKVLTRACAKAFGKDGLRVNVHGLRRTFNNLARTRTSDLVLKSITGHTTDAMTAHYSLVETDEKTAVSLSVADAIGLGSVPSPSLGKPSNP